MMKNPRKMAYIATLFGTVGLLAGCASMNPDQIRREMQNLTDAKKFDAARAVQVKSNPGGLIMSEEEKAKEQMIREVVNPAEIQYWRTEDTRKVNEFVSARNFNAARDLLWTPFTSSESVVQQTVAENRKMLLHETVNRTQYILTTNEMTKAVSAAVANKDYDAARKALNDVRRVRVFPKNVYTRLIGVRQALVTSGVTAERAETIVNGQLIRIFETIFPDPVYQVRTVKPGETYSPDDKPYTEALDLFRKTLEEYGIDAALTDNICKALDEVASELLKELWIPQEEYEVSPPDAIGTTKLNELIAATKTNLLETVIVPAQIATRVKELRDRVVPLLQKGQLDEARAAIHTFGVSGYSDVDDAVFAVKLGLLNAQVNPAEWKARSEALSGSVADALANCDPTKAMEAIAADRPVSVYGAQVAEALDAAASQSVQIGVDKDAAQAVVAATQGKIGELIAQRPESAREARIMQSYLDEVAGIADNRKPDDPDWSLVRKALDEASNYLIEDDFSKAEADALTSNVLAGFKALASGTSAPDPEAFTTEELNRKLTELKSNLSAKIAAAVVLMANASDIVEEAPSLTPETLVYRINSLRDVAAVKVSSEFAGTLHRNTTAAAQERIAESEADETAAKAKSEQLRQLALQMAERAAAAVDFDARINGFIEAVSDRSEKDINRMLGEGARILRLRRIGAELSREDATSLFVAAVYMGYDDVMNLALVLGADINGVSAKDALRRSPFLVALQYGFKGRACAVLEKASRQALDARGDGALHYAVRGGNGTALVQLLRNGVSAKSTGADGATPIVLASKLGYAGFVQALAPFSDLEKADDEGFTALLRAAQNGRLDIVRSLVSSGAELGAKTKDGDGALELAAKDNAPELLAWLLDEKKIVPTDRVVSQLVLARNVPTLQLMVAHGARLLDEHLALAVKQRDFPMVQYLVGRGTDVNAEIVKKVCEEEKENEEGAASLADILAYLHEQGQR